MPTIYNPNKRKGLFYIPSGAIKSESAAFSYSQDSYRVDESNPTPTITGDTGGTFTATPEGLTLNSSTGEITLSSSVINSYVVTYTLPSGTFENRSLGITAAAFSSTRSFSFDGVNDYFDCGNDISLQFTGSFTLSAWVKVNDSGSNAIVSKNSSSSYGNGYHIDFRSGNSVHAWAYNASNKVIVTGLSTGVWYNIIFVFESTGGSNGNQSLYVNAATPSTNSITNFSASTIKNLRIGDSEALSGTEMNGSIDEVAIWNSALSSAAVTEIASGPNDLDSLSNASSPIAWYRMGE